MRSTITLAALALALRASAQDAAPIFGTWSTGNGDVSTGGDFCSPAEMRFAPPVNTGISYSFTEDGYFEEAQYRYDSNPANPSCITGKLIFQHGKYVRNDDTSITLKPYGDDGRIQVQDPCAAQSNLVTYYNEPYTLKGSQVITYNGDTVLMLNAFDGAKLPPMKLKYNPPNMLPTQPLTGTNDSGQTVAKRDVVKIEARSSADAGLGPFGVAAAFIATALGFTFA